MEFGLLQLGFPYFKGFVKDIEPFTGYAAAIFQFVWPIALFFIVFAIAKSFWLAWRQSIFEKTVNWAMLEIKIPREIMKSPQAMEQVLKSMYNLDTYPSTPGDKWIAGQYPVPYAFEMVSFGGEVRFFARVPLVFKNTIKTIFFSHYPDIEITEADDYVANFPSSLSEVKQQGYDVGGGEIVLKREAAYPIKTYADFYDKPAEELQFDPISTLVEFLGSFKKEMTVGVQILAVPERKDWQKDWDELVGKLKTQVEKTKPEEAPRFVIRSPGETDTLAAVEKNLSKPSFQTIIRYLQLAPKSIFSESFIRKGIQGAFNQYTSTNLNSFVMNWGMVTLVSPWFKPYVFNKRRKLYKQNRILFNYIHRTFVPETAAGKLVGSYALNFNNKSKAFHLNVESLATIFHPPTHLVLTAPHIKRVESRKTGPPAGMAIFGDEKEIEKFQ